MPATRTLVKRFRHLPLTEVVKLLRASEHEARLLALLLMVDQYKRGSAQERNAIFDAYLANTRAINNWDLVDSSAHQIVGAHLETGDRSRLDRLAGSDLLWERRIAMVATFHFIRQSDFDDALRIAHLLLADPEDLMHKAVGWMLREVGKKDRATLDRFLRSHYRTMPRTALRYAIERHPEPQRKAYLLGQIE